MDFRPPGLRAVDTALILQTMETPRPLPNIGAPAIRALAEAGVHSLDDAEHFDLDQLAALHGVGPKAIRLLQAALKH